MNIVSYDLSIPTMHIIFRTIYICGCVSTEFCDDCGYILVDRHVTAIVGSRATYAVETHTLLVCSTYVQRLYCCSSWVRSCAAVHAPPVPYGQCCVFTCRVRQNEHLIVRSRSAARIATRNRVTRNSRMLINLRSRTTNPRLSLPQYVPSVVPVTVL